MPLLFWIKVSLLPGGAFPYREPRRLDSVLLGRKWCKAGVTQLVE